MFWRSGFVYIIDIYIKSHDIQSLTFAEIYERI